MTNFRTFKFIESGEKLYIECKKCDAPQVDYYDTPNELYSKSASISPINDTYSDIALTCNTCQNNEFVEGVPGIHI